MQPWKLHIILHYLNSDRDKHETEEPCIAPNPLTIASSLSITTKVPRSRLNQAAWPIGRYFIMVGPSKLPLLTIFVDASFMLGKFSQAKASEFKVQTEQNHFTPAAVHGIHYKMVHIYRVSRQGLPTALFRGLKPAFLLGCDSFSLPYRAPGPRPGSEKSTDTVRLQCRKNTGCTLLVFLCCWRIELWLKGQFTVWEKHATTAIVHTLSIIIIWR